MFFKNTKNFNRKKISEYFDPEYYLQSNKDVKENASDPIEHYLTVGYKEDRTPNRWFFPEFYRTSNSDLKDEPNLFLHYLLYGWKEKRLPNPLVNASFYEKVKLLDDIAAYFSEEKMASLKAEQKKNAELRKDKTEKEMKLLKKEEAEISLMQRYFNPEYYLEVNRDVKEKGMDPFQHYLKNGKEENRIPSRWFTPDFYLDKNPGLKKEGINPFLHYLIHGWKEKRLPNPYVNVSLYEDARTLDEIDAYFTEEKTASLKEVFQKNNEAEKLKNDKEIKRMKQKKAEYDIIQKYFDPEYYLEVNKDVKEKGIDPLQHYFKNGGKEENRIPNRWFSPGFYLDSNPNLKQSGINPFLHYLIHGWKEKRLPNPYVNVSLYEDAHTLDEIDAYFTEEKVNLLKVRKEHEMGYLNSVYTVDGETYVKGWAITGSDEKAAVEIFINGTLYTTVLADTYLESLKENGLGDGKYGFTVKLSKTQIKEQENIIEARSEFTGKHLINSPQLIPLITKE